MLSLDIKAIGTVREAAEGRSVLQVLPSYINGLHGLNVGDRVQILFWMHELEHSDRRALKVRPGGAEDRPPRGVFSLRSCKRPNPIGVSEADVVEVRDSCVIVVGLDARDGSPLIDIKAACS